MTSDSDPAAVLSLAWKTRPTDSPMALPPTVCGIWPRTAGHASRLLASYQRILCTSSPD